MTGEQFLNRLYIDLHLDEVVKHTAKGSKNKDEEVARYLERLERVVTKASKLDKINSVKELIYKKCIINEENIPSTFDKKEVIKLQKESLGKWIDYLTDKNAVYPMWAKYWALRGMLKIGTYDEANDTYGKRSNKTLSPFIEVNSEVLAKCIDYIRKFVEEGKIDESKKQLIVNGDFSKLYIICLNESKKIKIQQSDSNDGIWIKYNYGEKKDAEKLYDSLQGKNTGWCTAGSKDTAISQVCGGEGYLGGDFYVYYTKDISGVYSMPRIAIRMNYTNEISEIRGIDTSQNLEEGLEYIVQNKLNTMSFLREEDKKVSLKKCNDSRKLTEINQKSKKGISLTKEELEYLYEINNKIDTFGWDSDKRINEIRERVNLGILNNDREFVLKLIEINSNFIKYASEELRNDKEVVMEAVRRNGYALQYAKEEIKNDREVVMEAVRRNSGALEYAPEKLKKDKEIVMEAVKRNGYALQDAPEELKKDKEVVMEAVRRNCYALQYAKEELKNDGKFVLELIKINPDPDFIKYASEKFKNDKEFVLKLIEINSNFIKYASEELRNDKEVVMEAVRRNGSVLAYASEELRNDKEVVMEAVIRDGGSALKYASEELKNDEDILKILSDYMEFEDIFKL